jgi:putative tricarboxylic transport membrane protein
MKANWNISAYVQRCSILVVGLFLLAITLFTLQGTMTAEAAEGPKGPVEITVGTGAGGTPDVIMRRVAKILGEEKLVDQPIVIQNRTGGSWMVAVNWVLGKKGGYDTLMGIAQPVLTTPIVQGLKNAYDQFVPIAMFVQGDLMLVAQPDSPFKSLTDFVNAAKKTPRGVKFSGSQTGSTDHMVVGLLEKAAGVKFNYIPYDSGSAATASFLGKNVDGLVLALDEAVPLIESGKVKPLAILTEKRRTNKELKDFPTAKEQGIDLVWGQFWGVAGAPGMDPALVKWWNDRLQKMTATKAWKDAIDASFQRSDFIDYTKAPAYMTDQYQKYLQVLRDLGLSKQ